VFCMNLGTNSKFKRVVFITEVQSVYSAVRTDSLYMTDTFSLQKVKLHSKKIPIRNVKQRQMAGWCVTDRSEDVW
jgi:hypothetical protein